MDKLQIRAVIAGICFGIYPLLLNRSRLGGNMQSAVFCILVCLFVIPFAVKEVGELAHTYWAMVIGAGMASAMGMLSMTGFLAKASPVAAGTLIVMMIVTQTLVTAIYQVVMDKGVSFTRGLGFVLAAIAIVLMNRK